jgi:hypothetical protein
MVSSVQESLEQSSVTSLLRLSCEIYVPCSTYQHSMDSAENISVLLEMSI